jgi:hypothetical protein
MEGKITLKKYRKVMEKFDLDMKLWVNSDGIKMEKIEENYDFGIR